MAVDNIEFPALLAYGSSGGPEFSTDVTRLFSGYESRQQNWTRAVLQFDAAPAIHDPDRLQTLVSFFYARRGRARGFLFKDHTDYTSSADNQSDPDSLDQIIASGDGSSIFFQLKKTYSDSEQSYSRNITRPVSGSVSIALNEIPVTTGFSVNNTTGVVTFDTAPGIGVVIRAGFEFRIPVRFDTDYLETSIDAYQSYSTASVPIVEIRE